jgi:hypothetical protein
MTIEMFGLQAEAKPLVGKVCAIPRISGHGCWWTSIIDQSPCGKFIRVKGGGAMGRRRWVAVKDVGHICDGRKDAKRSRK